MVELTVQQQKARAKARAKLAVQAPPFSGGILPISRQEPGGPVSFDSNAGIVGSVKRAVTLTRDVMEGKVDLNSDEGIGRVLEMATFGTPMNPGIRAGDKIIPGIGRAPTKQAPAIPTAADLTRVGGKQIDKSTKMGVDFKSEAVTSWARNLRAELERDIHPSRAEGSYKLLYDLERAPAGSVMEFRGLVAARENFSDVARAMGSNPKDRLAATRIIKRIDEFLAEPPPASVLAGSSEAASKQYVDGRGNYAAGKRSDRINAREDNAELQAVIANSGRNIGNRVRAAAGWYLDALHPERLDGFSKGEIALIRNVSEGNTGRNTLRYVGNLLGGGGGFPGLVAGLATGTGAGAYAGRPGVGAVAGILGPAVGIAARSADNRLTSAAMRKADEAVRMRNPMYAERSRNAPPLKIQPPARAAIKGGAAKGAVAPALTPPTMTQEEYRRWLAAGNA